MNAKNSILIVFVVSMTFISGCTLRFSPWKNKSSQSKDNPEKPSAGLPVSTSSENPPVVDEKKQTQAIYGKEFSLVEGGSSVISTAEGLAQATLKLVSVDEDSRCPIGVTCIWEGQAAVRFQFTAPSPSSASDLILILRAGHEQLAQKAEKEFTFRILSLEPVPVQGVAKTSSRVAKLLIVKN